MLTRCWLPPESRPTSSSARSSRPVCSSIRATAVSGSASFSSRANSRRFSATDSFEYSAGCCGTQPISEGLHVISPSVAGSTPARIESSVVLPAPLGPMIATSSPGEQLEADALQRGPRAEALGQRAGRQGCGRAACGGAGRHGPQASSRPEGRALAGRADARLERGAARAAERVAGAGRVPQSGHRSGPMRSTPVSGETAPHGSSTRWRRRYRTVWRTTAATGSATSAPAMP